MAEDWGPWIAHDGRGCPDIVGRDIQCVVRRNESVPVTTAEHLECSFSAPWLWAVVPCERQIIRYRLRKPRGLAVLESLLADLPEKVDA